MTTKKTYCRICEAHCGLEVTVDGDQIVAVKPDKTHPVSRGYACVKGTSLGDLHHDPDRINYPMKQVNGQWQRISWHQAIGEIGQRSRQLRAKYGNRSLAHYIGNPSGFSMQNFLYALQFMPSLKSPNAYSSVSIDVNNKFYVSEQMYGMPDVHPVPDFENCEFFMCLGSNPLVSQMSIVSVPHAVDRLKGVESRGGRVLIVDPRKTETAKKVGEHIFIRPGTDAWLLMAMLHVIVHESALDTSAFTRQARGVRAFIDAAKPWTPERVAPITGISAVLIREVATAYAQSSGGVLYMSTGVNMGPFGSIAYWLIQGLSLLTGNLDAKGGLIFSQGASDLSALAKFIEGKKANSPTTLRDRWPQVAGAFPSAALADEITVDHPQRIRALFVSAGNPVHAIPGNRLAEAFSELDLLVCIDIYQNETAQYADYLLPATDMLERADFPLSHSNFQVEPHAQYTPSMVDAKFERRQEWWIFTQLAMACGARPFGPTLLNFPAYISRWLDRLPGMRGLRPDDLLALLLLIGGKTSLRELKRKPQGVKLAPMQPGNFLGKRVLTADGLVNLAPAAVIADLGRLLDLEKVYTEPTAGLRIIGRRERRSHNSWMHNNRRINHASGNHALIHPDDARKLGISDGQIIDVGDTRTIRLTAKLTDDIMPGVLCVPHGWGHTGSGLSKARKLPGGNINEVIPNVAQHIEPVSGQAIMLAHPLTVRPAGVRRAVV